MEIVPEENYGRSLVSYDAAGTVNIVWGRLEVLGCTAALAGMLPASAD